MRLHVHGIATGGDGVGRDADGRVVFVAGALPGETVHVEVTAAKKRFAHARLLEVIEPSELRREPPCRHVAEGCGGCDFAHVTATGQAALKTTIVSDVLERIGRIADPPVRFAGSVAEFDYRTTVRGGVVDGQLGMRRARSHDVVATPDCRVASAAVRNVLQGASVDRGDDVVVRVGDGDSVNVLIDDAVDGRLGDASGRLVITVAGQPFRVSAPSFFQSGPSAGELLVREVDAMVRSTGRAADPAATLLDLYGGVGLFAGTVDFAGAVVVVEVSPHAVGDARHNLAHLGERAAVVEADVKHWAPVAADVVVADPSRRGLEAAGVGVVTGTGATDVVLVSCDAGALGRDAGLLVAEGFTLRESAVLDLFPGTSHVEIVSHFTRSEA